MAEKKSTKRIEKKRTQQSQRANLRQSGKSEKEVKHLKGTELSKASAKVDQKRRYDANRQYLLDLGIDKSIISKKQLYRRTDKFLQDKQNITKWKRESRELGRYRKLLDAGYSKDDIKKSWLRSDRATAEKIPYERELLVYKNRKSLLVQYADIMGDSNIDPDMYKDWTFEEIVEAINERYSECRRVPDGSESFHGAFRIQYHEDKSALRYASEKWERRGYDVSVGKFNKNSYDTVTLKNDFTLREFAEMTLLMMEHSSNTDAMVHYQTFRAYAEGFSNKSFRRIFKYND